VVVVIGLTIRGGMTLPICRTGKVKSRERKKSYTLRYFIYNLGSGSSVGIATDFVLDRPGSNPDGARFFALVETGPGAHPSSCTTGTGSFPGVNCDRGLTKTPHPLLVPWLRKSIAIPLLPLWTYGLYRASVAVQGCTLRFLTYV
jgi:hypothetical protein